MQVRALLVCWSFTLLYKFLQIKFSSKYFLKVELILNVERFLPDFIREKWIVKTEKIFPNQRTNIFSLFLFNTVTYKNIVEKVQLEIKNIFDI